jgi:RHS repeat-associated protein
MGIDALDHVYFHGRQTFAGDNHPFVYHATDGLRPETILEWQCLQTGGGTPTCTGTGTGTRRYVLGPGADERWAYIAAGGGVYGAHTDRAGTLIALAAGGERRTGQRLDFTTGLCDDKARDYSPKLGRFIQPDPAGLDQGPNLYAYVDNDPVNAGDPIGSHLMGLV